MKKKSRFRVFFSILLTSSLLSGCGETVMEVPELIESVAIRESYRPVEYGDVGKIEMAYGNIVPMDYCYFWNIATDMKTLNVKIGDYVEKGDILASADTDEAHEELDRLKRQITYENTSYEVSEENYRYQHEELEYASGAAWVAGQSDKTEQISKQIKALEENHNYDVIMHEFQMDQLHEQMEEYQKLIDSEFLIAEQSGYVTYAREMVAGKRAASLENVVIVSDYEDTHIEIPSFNMAKFSRNKLMIYEKFYTEIDGKRYNLIEYEYTPEEQVIIENRSLYPSVRFLLDDESVELPPVSTTIPIYMVEDAVENVLCVGNDSLYMDSYGDYVYVMNGDQKELRYIQLGKKGDTCSEVLSGLQEGDIVCYSITDLMPTEYDICEVEKGDFGPYNSVTNYGKSATILASCYSEYSGKLIDIEAYESRPVEKGELICQIETENGTAGLMEMTEELRVLKENYELQLSGFEDQRNGIYQQSVGLAGQYLSEVSPLRAQLEKGTNAEGKALASGEIQGLKNAIEAKEQYFSFCHQQLDSRSKQVDCSEKQAEITYLYQKKEKDIALAKAKKNNDGAGIINIYAEEDGAIYASQMKIDQTVNKGDLLFCIVSAEDDMILYGTNDGMRIDQKVTLGSDEDEKGKKYEGKVIGIADSSKVYLNHVGEDTYLTTSFVNYSRPVYIIGVTDSFFFHEVKSFPMKYLRYDMKNVMTVPRAAVHAETVENKDFNYVWKMEDGVLMKQYVEIVAPPTDASLDNYCILSGVEIGDRLAK